SADEPASWYDRWFVVDDLTTVDGRITHIEFRFCVGCRAGVGAGAVRGAISWTAAPTITGVPETGQRRGGDLVHIDGRNLASASSVTIGGAPAEIVENTDGGVLRVRTPALPVGEHAVVVTTAGGVATSGAGHGYTSVANRPLAADGVRATALAAGALVEWAAPNDTGDAPITGVKVDLWDTPYFLENLPTASVTVDPDATSAVIAPLEQGHRFVATVTYLSTTATGERSPATAAFDVLPADVTPFDGLPALVTQQYLDFAGRAPTSSERNAAVTSIRTGKQLPEAFVASMRNRPEWGGVRSPLTRLYSSYFGRLPDAGGLAFWSKKLRSGTSLAKASSTFAASSEFRRTYGSLSNGAFVDLVYQNVLHRAPDASGRAYWVRKLAAGASRGTVMAGFSESSEHVRTMAPTVDAVLLYSGMLRRMPTAAEVPAATASDAGRAAASSPADPVALAEQLRRTPAYAARF
ncbi:MAG: DUF4214 domain-containing protein, partial [Aquihabitans sp.]